MNALLQLQKEIQSHKDPVRAKSSVWFFKTGKGQYGEGDVFLGLTVPLQRSVAKKFNTLPLEDLQKMLESKFHEYRFTALEILVMQFEKASIAEKKKIFNFYIKNSVRVNNWDLVDASAPYVTGEFLADKPRIVLYKFAQSGNLWKKRIAIVSTFAFIKRGEFADTLKIAELLLSDTHDLLHKAVGWALREVGKKDEKVLLKFLRQHYANLPRTTLRYAIEKFSSAQRKNLLQGIF